MSSAPQNSDRKNHVNTTWGAVSAGFSYCPEQYQPEWLDAISPRLGGWPNIKMTVIQQRFLNGLIRKERPRKILEIGTSCGGSAAVMLNAIKDDPDARLYSVDLAKNCHENPNKPIGYLVRERFSELIAPETLGSEGSGEKWTPFFGGYVSDFLETIGNEIDFCLLDSSHLLPGEILDFLLVLPYLKENVVVAVHDTALHMIVADVDHRYAYTPNFLLMNLADGEKCFVNEHRSDDALPNMGALRLASVSTDADYVDTLFRMLTLPWSELGIDGARYSNFADFLARFYRSDQLDLFQRAYLYQSFLHQPESYKRMCFAADHIIPLLDRGRKIALWGAGRVGLIGLQAFSERKIKIDFFVDNDAEKIGRVYGDLPVIGVDELVELAATESIQIVLALAYPHALIRQIRSLGLLEHVKGILPG